MHCFRFGMKKDEVSPETSSGSKKEEKESREEKAGRAAIESEFSVLIDAEKSYEEQLKIGRPLFMSLLSTGTVANIGEEVGPLQGVSETMALMISFQADRQIRSVRHCQYITTNHKSVSQSVSQRTKKWESVLMRISATYCGYEVTE